MSRFSFRDGDPTSEGVSWPDERVLVNLPVIHDQHGVLFRLVQQGEVLERVTVDQQVSGSLVRRA
jgi:hypothetical protein